MKDRVKKENLRVFSNDTVYTMINGELTECKLLKTIFTADMDDTFLVTTIFQLPDGTIQQNGVYYDTAYRTPECYVNNVKAPTVEWSLDTAITNIFNQRDVASYCQYFKDGKTFYIFENGEPKAHTPKYDTICFDYEQRAWNSKEVPNEPIYWTHKAACSYNTIKVVDANGNESERIGCNKLLELDDDQKELVGQLECIVSKLRDSGVALLADTSDRYAAYNMRHVENFVFALDKDDINRDDANKFEMVDRYGEPFNLDIDIEQWSEDHNLFIKRK